MDSLVEGSRGGILWWAGLKEVPIAVGVATCFMAFILASDPESP